MSLMEKICMKKGHKWKITKHGYDYSENIYFEESVCTRCGKVYSITRPIDMRPNK